MLAVVILKLQCVFQPHLGSLDKSPGTAEHDFPCFVYAAGSFCRWLFAISSKRNAGVWSLLQFFSVIKTSLVIYKSNWRLQTQVIILRNCLHAWYCVHLSVLPLFYPHNMMGSFAYFTLKTWHREIFTVLKLDAALKASNSLIVCVISNWEGFQLKYGEMQCLCNMTRQTNEPSMADQGCTEKPLLDFIWYRREWE